MGWRTGNCRINSGMHIRTLLTEGVIQVPQDWINDAMQIVASIQFKYLIDFFTSKGDKESVALVKHQSRIVGKKYGGLNLDLPEMPLDGFHFGPLSLPVDWDKLDARYRKNGDDHYELKITVGIQNSPENAAWYDDSGQTPVIHIDLSKTDFFKYLHKRQYIRYVKDHCEMLEGSIEHELMHYIQQMGLNQDLETPARAYYDKKGKLDHDKYFNTEFEFGPNVLTSYKAFSARIAAMKRSGKEVDVDALARQYVTGVSEFGENSFFEALRRTNPKKWQKAVKYFNSLLQNRSPKK